MIIFILGMHRSGTSMITGILKICGAWVGKNLLMGARDNPKGHFENKDFMHLNVRLLRENGGKWFLPPVEIEYKTVKKDMVRFLKSLPEKRTIVLKDPRTALTFNLWRKLITNRLIRIVYIFRSHEAVAKSLHKRNGINFYKGINLSKYYNNKIEKCFIFNLEHNLFRCNYDDFFIAKKEQIVYDLCEFAGLEKPDKNKMKIINDFITPELRHWK